MSILWFKNGKEPKIDKNWESCDKEDVLTFQMKIVPLIVNKPKRSLEINP